MALSERDRGFWTGSAGVLALFLLFYALFGPPGAAGGEHPCCTEKVALIKAISTAIAYLEAGHPETAYEILKEAQELGREKKER